MGDLEERAFKIAQDAKDDARADIHGDIYGLDRLEETILSALRAVRAEEREACATEAERKGLAVGGDGSEYALAAKHIAASIRARGEKP